MDPTTPRSLHLSRVQRALKRSPVVALLGPRQCGKTTLARMATAGHNATYFDLESEPDRRRLHNPELALGSAAGLIVLDEIQRAPELFEVLRVVVDRPSLQARFLILGSASPHIVKRASESLAGRIELLELTGFGLGEVSPAPATDLWCRGGFPRSFLAATDDDSFAWRRNFIQTFLERDLPQLGINIPAAAMRRFWTMVAHAHGQRWNASTLARSMGMSDKTVRSYLDILSGTYMVRQLQPWFENLGKRQVKAPKIYLRDSGLLHALLDLPTAHALAGHPAVGASWEGFALEQVLQVTMPSEAYFWATHNGAELDLFMTQRGQRFGFAMKHSEAPTITRSMRTALEDLRLDKLYVIYPGHHRYTIEETIEALPVSSIPTLAEELENR